MVKRYVLAVGYRNLSKEAQIIRIFKSYMLRSRRDEIWASREPKNLKEKELNRLISDHSLPPCSRYSQI